VAFRRAARCSVPSVSRRSDQATAVLEGQVSEFERFGELAETMGVDGIRAIVVQVAREANARAVRMFFRHDEFPGVLFAYRSWPAGTDPHECVWLAEEIATGALHRMMRSKPGVADADGVVWIQLLGQHLVARPGASAGQIGAASSGRNDVSRVASEEGPPSRDRSMTLPGDSLSGGSLRAES